MNIEQYRQSRKKVNNSNKLTKVIANFISRSLVTVIIFLVGLIICKNNASMKEFINKNIYTNSIKFTQIKNKYDKYLGKYFGTKNTTTSVFTEKLSYNKANVYKDGVKLTVSDKYLVPALESGIVVFIGNKEEYGNTVIIEQIDGINVWYSNIEQKDIKMYDYVEKGSLIGEVKNKNLYLIFQKDGKYLDYKKYI